MQNNTIIYKYIGVNPVIFDVFSYFRSYIFQARDGDVQTLPNVIKVRQAIVQFVTNPLE